MVAKNGSEVVLNYRTEKSCAAPVEAVYYALDAYSKMKVKSVQETLKDGVVKELRGYEGFSRRIKTLEERLQVIEQVKKEFLQG